MPLTKETSLPESSNAIAPTVPVLVADRFRAVIVPEPACVMPSAAVRFTLPRFVAVIASPMEIAPVAEVMAIVPLLVVMPEMVSVSDLPLMSV